MDGGAGPGGEPRVGGIRRSGDPANPLVCVHHDCRMPTLTEPSVRCVCVWMSDGLLFHVEKQLFSSQVNA